MNIPSCEEWEEFKKKCTPLKVSSRPILRLSKRGATAVKVEQVIQSSPKPRPRPESSRGLVHSFYEQIV